MVIGKKDFSSKRNNPGREMVFAMAILCLALAWCIPCASAQSRNLSVAVYGPGDFADVWLGISGGGYELLAEKGRPYTFEVFVKNGMPESQMTNLEISPKEFPFEITSITPKSFEMIRPMEIVMFKVNATIPADAQVGKYNFAFDVKSDQFPKGVFKYEDVIKVVEKINVPLYAGMAGVCVLILGVLIWRKYRFSRQ